MPSITIFDGARSIGGNKIYVESEGRGIFFDFGINYRKMQNFYEEFLRPRAARGIHDLLHMGLIPWINNYRPDLTPADVDLSRMRKLSVEAAFISHAHLDHAGCLGLLDLSIPAVATPTTAAILKAMRDIRADVSTEAAYTTPREASGEDARVISPRPWRKAPYLGRDFLIAGDAGDAFRDFWTRCPGSRRIKAGALRPLDELSFELKVWEVDHSIYGATACALETSSGWVVYTGDIRAHGMLRKKTARFVSEARALAPQVLIAEGTRAGEEIEQVSEEEVHKTCLEATLEERRLVVADFSPRNLERLDTFAKIAREAGRELVVLARDAYLLDALEDTHSTGGVNGLLIYRELKARRDAYEKEVFARHGDKLVDPRDIASSPESYILCFSFWDVKHLLDIKPEGGTYIYSSSEAYTEEQVIDFLRLYNWLKFFNFEVRGFGIVEKKGKPAPAFERGYHASGHASGEEMLRMVEEIQPEVLIPVHTENPEFFAERLEGVRVEVVGEGERLVV
ncbi:MBL fold metallo-hydrolase RNA specificity domain-containing protein [Candidatus Pyrohabitans sp.]